MTIFLRTNNIYLISFYRFFSDTCALRDNNNEMLPYLDPFINIV